MHFRPKWVLAAALSVLSFVGSTNGYKYSASSLETGRTAVIGVYALVFIGVAGLSIIALDNAHKHRGPYVPLAIATILALFAELASTAFNFLLADPSLVMTISYRPYLTALSISSLFWTWSLPLVFLAFAHLIKVGFDNIVRDSGNETLRLDPKWTFAYFVVFVLLMIFSSAAEGAYISFLQLLFRDIFRDRRKKWDVYNGLHYTFNALWYASVFPLGALAVVAYRTARRATGAGDKILKTLLYVVLPIHVLHIIVQTTFLILFSPAGLSPTSGRATREGAFLAEALLDNGLRVVTIAIIIVLGLRWSKWTLTVQPSDWQKGQYVGYPAYPMQVTYAVQPSYPNQQNYQYQTQQ